jgi:3-deoxy-D-manno-octulosonic-acid transferase
LHGPNVQNFKDIYQLFNKSKIAHKFINTKQLINISDKLLMSKKNKKLNLVKMGNLILKRSVIEINKVLNYELKKT